MNLDFLKSYTQARIGLNRSGHAVSTREQLEFQWAHAQARDAIHTAWDYKSLQSDCDDLQIPSQVLNTRIQDRTEYLKRPDLGRILNERSIRDLNSFPKKSYDIALLVSNGLSSEAIHRHAKPFLHKLIPEIQKQSFSCSPVFLIPNARVAISDAVGEIIKPKLSLILIGERPGLSSPDSMGIYLTYEPYLGRTDKDRNCISNIHEPYGLSYDEALFQLLFLMKSSLRHRLSGVLLKNDKNANLP